jgi:hypothetical protein
MGADAGCVPTKVALHRSSSPRPPSVRAVGAECMFHGARGLASDSCDAAVQGPGPRWVYASFLPGYLGHHQARDHERVQCLLVLGHAVFSGNQWHTAGPAIEETRCVHD